VGWAGVNGHQCENEQQLGWITEREVVSASGFLFGVAYLATVGGLDLVEIAPAGTSLI
jgi:hypothetical protein